MSFYKNKILYFIISCYVTCISLYATDIVRPKSTDSIGDKLITNQCNENNYIEIKDRLNTDSYISNTSKMLTKYIMKNTPPHPYEPREILYIDSYSGGKYVLKMNELQFKKYNFNKLTKQISKLSKYYKKQNIQFKKMQNNLQVKKGLINDVSVQFYKKFYIRKNEELYYYMDLLDYLIEGNDKLNTDINNGIYNNENLLKHCNYADMYDIKFTFDIFIENICKVMKNSDQVKEYNLEKEIDKFRLGLQTNIDNTERRDFVWDEFLNYFEDE